MQSTRRQDQVSWVACLVGLVLVGCGDDDAGATASGSGGGTDTEATSAGTMDTASAGPGTTTADDDSDSATDTSTTQTPGTEATSDTADATSDTADATSDTSGTEGTTTDSTDTETGSSTGDETGDDSTGTEGMQACTCAQNTDLIYVLSDDAELWSFDPDTLMFTQITPSLGCPQTDTFSMSVDRNGIAHVMFQNDDIYTIDVNNPNNCVDPGYAPGQLGFNKFGMGFVSNSLFDPCDKLYAHSWSGQGGFSEGPNAGRLGVLDPETLTMQEIGSIDYDGGELTGTGDGRLFAFAGSPAKLIEYDKSDASVIGETPLNMSLTNAFAFAFHGGDFYLFTEANQNSTVSKVTHFDYDDTQMLTTVVQQGPIRIVGAGVSTCAPIIR